MHSSCFLQVTLQLAQAGEPERAVALDPAGDLLHRRRLQFVETLAADAVFLDQPRLPQRLQVLGNGGGVCEKSAARAFTGAGPARSRSRIARRVGSAMARKTSVEALAAGMSSTS